MTTDINSYDTLIEVAKKEEAPQRLLFLFLKSFLMDDHTAEEARRFEEGQGGGLKALFHVNFAPDELSTFDALASESEKMDPDWQIVLVGCLAGEGGEPPTGESIDEWLTFMQQAVLNGSPLSQFLAYDRGGEPVYFS